MENKPTSLLHFPPTTTSTVTVVKSKHSPGLGVHKAPLLPTLPRPCHSLVAHSTPANAQSISLTQLFPVPGLLHMLFCLECCSSLPLTGLMPSADVYLKLKSQHPQSFRWLLPPCHRMCTAQSGNKCPSPPLATIRRSMCSVPGRHSECLFTNDSSSDKSPIFPYGFEPEKIFAVILYPSRIPTRPSGTDTSQSSRIITASQPPSCLNVRRCLLRSWRQVEPTAVMEAKSPCGPAGSCCYLAGLFLAKSWTWEPVAG